MVFLQVNRGKGKQIINALQVVFNEHRQTHHARAQRLTLHLSGQNAMMRTSETELDDASCNTIGPGKAGYV